MSLLFCPNRILLSLVVGSFLSACTFLLFSNVQHDQKKTLKRNYPVNLRFTAIYRNWFTIFKNTGKIPTFELWRWMAVHSPTFSSCTDWEVHLSTDYVCTQYEYLAYCDAPE